MHKLKASLGTNLGGKIQNLTNDEIKESLE
jgi:hypothetical protein